MTRRRPPDDLGDDGRTLWRAIETWRAEMVLRFDPHEQPLVAEACRQLDRLASLRAAIKQTVPNDPAWTRMATEERLGRIAYGRLVAQLGLPTGAVPQPGNVTYLTPASRRAQKAANARWSRHRASLADGVDDEFEAVDG